MSPVNYPPAQYSSDAEQITIYYDQEYFAAWPFNHGFKAFSPTELMIGFSRGPLQLRLALRYGAPRG